MRRPAWRRARSGRGAAPRADTLTWNRLATGGDTRAIWRIRRRSAGLDAAEQHHQAVRYDLLKLRVGATIDAVHVYRAPEVAAQREDCRLYLPLRQAFGLKGADQFGAPVRFCGSGRRHDSPTSVASH